MAPGATKTKRVISYHSSQNNQMVVCEESWNIHPIQHHQGLSHGKSHGKSSLKTISSHNHPWGCWKTLTPNAIKFPWFIIVFPIEVAVCWVICKEISRWIVEYSSFPSDYLTNRYKSKVDPHFYAPWNLSHHQSVHPTNHDRLWVPGSPSPRFKMLDSTREFIEFIEIPIDVVNPIANHHQSHYR